MNRESTILIEHDTSGAYEVEVFDTSHPKSIVVCVHGRGVHREDGEAFFYAIAKHYPDHVFILVDQNQFDGDTCLLSPLKVALGRVQRVIGLAHEKYPEAPLVLLGHSMGSGLITQLDLTNVSRAIFVAPAAGKETDKLISRYGADVANGKVTISSDGLKKNMSKEYFESVQGVVGGDEYRRLLAHFASVYVFESGDEEIVCEERFELRDMPFANYEIIPGATHNVHDKALQQLFASLNSLL